MKLLVLPHNVQTTHKRDGSVHLRSKYDLPPLARCTADWLHHWAEFAPERVAFAERDGANWSEIRYRDLLTAIRAIAASFLGRGLNETTPIAILSGNSIGHQLVSLAAQYVGIPTIPLAEQYSLIPAARKRLDYIFDKSRPKAVYVENVSTFADALDLPQIREAMVFAKRTSGPHCRATGLADLQTEGAAERNVDAAQARVDHKTLAKILFTSGSTGHPKGVPTTQKMMCVEAAQCHAVLPMLSQFPLLTTDWLPWNHVFGGSHNVNMVLSHGGTMSIDDGRPTKEGIARTIENIKTRRQTVAFNVPVGFAMLAEAMSQDAELRKAYFQDLKMLFYAGASLPREVHDKLLDMIAGENIESPLFSTALGMTETAPSAVFSHENEADPKSIGVPLPEIDVKLIPNGRDRFELRVKGPNVMTGYYNDLKATKSAFDEEGYYLTHDAVSFIEPGNANRGLKFEGRISEEFKLSTGTWVQPAPIRQDVLIHLKDLVLEVVVCGHERDEIGLLIFPKIDLIQGLDVSSGAVVDQGILQLASCRLEELASGEASSSKKIGRALILADPPSLKDHELTDKGSISNKAVIAARSEMVDLLYDDDFVGLIRV